MGNRTRARDSVMRQACPYMNRVSEGKGAGWQGGAHLGVFKRAMACSEPARLRGDVGLVQFQTCLMTPVGQVTAEIQKP
jgi:hypothetical protein